MNNRFRLAINLLSIVGFYVGFLCSQTVLSAEPVSRPRLTVWVHGTTIRAVIPIKISGFHFDAALMPFTKLRPNSQAYRRSLALNQGDNQRFPLDNFYLFRWNGMLNTRERHAASQKLYHYLNDKIAQIRSETGKDPIVTIIAHSHGGNIALNLASLIGNNQAKLVIHNLILLACPVQSHTAHWVKHDIFEKIYVFYSSGDWIQRLALQNNKRFADRKFDKITGLANKLIHIKTSWQRYHLWHNDFKGLAFVTRLPGSLKMIDQQINQGGDFSVQDYILTL